jgi:hypothetical protein
MNICVKKMHLSALIWFLLTVSAVQDRAADVTCWRWSPLRCHVQVFPEIHVGTAIYEDIAVVYYTAKSEAKPLNSDLVNLIKEASIKHKIDPSTLPMSEQLGHMLLHDTNTDEYYMVIVQEHGIVIFHKAEAKFSEPPIYQPLHGRRAKTQVFHSELIAKSVLAIDGVAIPDKDLPPWIKKKAGAKMNPRTN